MNFEFFLHAPFDENRPILSRVLISRPLQLFCSFFLCLLFFSPASLAQYDLSGNFQGDTDSLIEVGVDPAGELNWTTFDLENGVSRQLATFGLATDFPLLGRWQLGEGYTPGLIRSDRGLSFLAANHQGERLLPWPTNKMQYLLSGDLNGDTLTDLVNVTTGPEGLRWEILNSPLISQNTKKHFIFGLNSSKPFVFLWRAKYASFGVLQGVGNKKRTLELSHCFGSCKRVRTIKIPREVLIGYEDSEILVSKVQGQRELILFMNGRNSILSSTLSAPALPSQFVAIDRTGKALMSYSFSFRGAMSAGRFFKSSLVSSVALVADRLIQAVWFDTDGNPNEVEYEIGQGCPLSIFAGIELKSYFQKGGIESGQCEFDQPSVLMPTLTPSSSPTETDTPTGNPTSTSIETNTPTPTPTFASTHTNTSTPTPTFTSTHTNTPTPTPTFTSTRTNTPTSTPTFSSTHTNTPTPTPTFTSTHTNTPTASISKISPSDSTSNSSNSGFIVTVSSFYANDPTWAGWHAVDGNSNTEWASGENVWWSADFTRIVTVNYVKIAMGPDAVGYSEYNRDFTIQYSTDNINFYIAFSKTGETSSAVGEFKTYTFASPVLARYWRIDITSANGYAHIGEVEFWGS